MNDTGMNEPANRTEGTIFTLLHAAHALEDRVEASLAGVGLSMPKYSVLNELVNTGKPLSLSDLAARLSCVKSNMTQLIDRLETDGLVKRVDDPADRRSVKAAVTEEGRARHAAGQSEIDRLNKQFAAMVGADERAVVERLIGAIK